MRKIVRQALILKAHRDKDMPQLIEGRLSEEIFGKVDRELRGILMKLADERRTVERGDQRHQVFDLS